jgi:3-oxoacyl-[acyl-carrier-protein] synthase II
MASRILVTGLGVVSPIGHTLDGFWNALLYEESWPDEYPYARSSYMPNRLAYRVRDDPATGATAGAASRTVRFAVRAAEMALQDAGLLPLCDADAIGVCLGTATGNHDLREAERERGERSAPIEAYPFTVTSAVAQRLALGGPALTISTACAAGCYSVSVGSEAILSGLADVMVVGGADTISRVTQACFNRMNALDTQACRPFDANRGGTVYGEGAAVLVLESERHARQRGHTESYAAIEGCGWSCDGHHPTAPDPSGIQIQHALHRALADADLTVRDIDCIVAHGTGTELNDIAESRGMEHAFGAALDRVLVCAPKSKLGHTAGAAGAFSCLTAALILDRGLVPPTAHLTSIDPRCALRLHTEWPVPTSARHVLVNAYAFGGNNISVVLGRPQP